MKPKMFFFRSKNTEIVNKDKLIYVILAKDEEKAKKKFKKYIFNKYIFKKNLRSLLSINDFDIQLGDTETKNIFRTVLL